MISSHSLFEEILSDIKDLFDNVEVNIFEIELLEDPKFTELQYYIHNCGFYLVNLKTWQEQLEIGTDLLTNYAYKKDSKYSRIDHLRYNIENYIIRFQSISDKILQLINAVFHLTIDEGEVGNSVIMTNLKVKKSKVPQSYSPIKKYLKKLYNDRNTIIHRHSYLDKDLKKLEIFYTSNGNDIDPNFLNHRTNLLKEYIQTRKTEFEKYNSDLNTMIVQLLDELILEYRKQKIKLA